MVLRDRDPKTDLIDLFVYYEVTLENREEVKKNSINLVLMYLLYLSIDQVINQLKYEK